MLFEKSGMDAGSILAFREERIIKVHGNG